MDDDHKRLRLTQWKQRYLGGGLDEILNQKKKKRNQTKFISYKGLGYGWEHEAGLRAKHTQFFFHVNMM